MGGVREPSEFALSRDLRQQCRDRRVETDHGRAGRRCLASLGCERQISLVPRFDGLQQRIISVPGIPERQYSQLRAGVAGTVYYLEAAAGGGGRGGGFGGGGGGSVLQRYRVTRIYDNESWNPDLRAPLSSPGVDIAAGDYILAINGIELKAPDNIYRLLDGTANRQTVLTVNSRPEMEGARKVTNEMAGSGGDLMPWMFKHRKIGLLVGKRTWGGLVHTADTPPFTEPPPPTWGQRKEQPVGTATTGGKQRGQR